MTTLVAVPILLPFAIAMYLSPALCIGAVQYTGTGHYSLWPSACFNHKKVFILLLKHLGSVNLKATSQCS